MHRFVFRSPRLGFLAVGPALARPAAAFYRRNRAAFAPFDPCLLYTSDAADE